MDLFYVYIIFAIGIVIGFSVTRILDIKEREKRNIELNHIFKGLNRKGNK